MYSANLSSKSPYQNRDIQEENSEAVDLDIQEGNSEAVDLEVQENVQKVQKVFVKQFSSDDCYFGKPLPATCCVFGTCCLLTSPSLCLGSGFMCKAGSDATLFLTGEIFAGIAAGITGIATCVTCTGCTTLAGLIYYIVES